MNIIILAGGYGTRLQADIALSTKHSELRGLPKALLPIGGSCIFDILLRWIQDSGSMHDVVVVSNALYYDQFKTRCDSFGVSVRVVNNNTSRPEDRLGAIGDLLLGLSQLPPGDTIVLGSDTLFSTSLLELVTKSKRVASNIHLAYKDDSDEIKKKGVIEIDGCDKIMGFEEKPMYPKSHIAGIPVYLFTSETIPHLKMYAAEYPDKLDRLGDLIRYLIIRSSWYAIVEGEYAYDIGSLGVYEQAVKNVLP